MSISEYDDEIRTRKLLIRTYVEKPPVLWIVAGQSNAVGYAQPAYEAAKYCGSFWYWYNSAGELRPLKDPTCGLLAAYQNFGSAWPSFARTFFELTGRKVALLNVARGGSAVTSPFSNTWYGEDEGNELRVNATTQFNAMATALGTANDDYVLGGLLWIQGEAETSGLVAENVTVSEYKSGTLDVFRFFRELTSTPNLPIFISQIGYQSTVKTNPDLLDAYHQIQAAQTELARDNANVYMALNVLTAAVNPKAEFKNRSEERRVGTEC